MSWLPWLLIPYAVMSPITFFAFALDKHRATHNKHRIPERTLHLLELTGGWPGAWAGQAWLRHKSQKRGYRFVLACIVVLHLALWVGLIWLAR